MSKIDEAITILADLGLPTEQQNKITALCLLALCNLTEEKKWAELDSPLLGITPMMDFAAEKFKERYAPNSRETFRRQSIHQLVDAGLVVRNPTTLLELLTVQILFIK